MSISTHIESKSKLKEGLPRECQFACLCALNKLQDIYGQIQNGNVTIKELHNIKSNKGQMKRLCAAATHQDNQTELAFACSALHQRLEEFQTFERNRDCLFHLCNELHGDDIQGNYYSLQFCLIGNHVQHITINCGKMFPRG